jgi:hypothetical protein
LGSNLSNRPASLTEGNLAEANDKAEQALRILKEAWHDCGLASDSDSYHDQSHLVIQRATFAHMDVASHESHRAFLARYNAYANYRVTFEADSAERLDVLQTRFDRLDAETLVQHNEMLDAGFSLRGMIFEAPRRHVRFGIEADVLRAARKLWLCGRPLLSLRRRHTVDIDRRRMRLHHVMILQTSVARQPKLNHTAVRTAIVAWKATVCGSTTATAGWRSGCAGDSRLAP